MSDVLAVLASTAGAALVAAAATDVWGTARDRFRRLLGRDEPDRQDQIDGWLDSTETAVARAEPAVARQLAQRWAVRIEDHLERHPGSAGEVEDLVSYLREAGGPRLVQAIATGAVEQRRVSGPTVANTGIVQGDIRVDGRQ